MEIRRFEERRTTMLPSSAPTPTPHRASEEIRNRVQIRKGEGEAEERHSIQVRKAEGGEEERHDVEIRKGGERIEVRVTASPDA